jgi:hypothetical protein
VAEKTEKAVICLVFSEIRHMTCLIRQTISHSGNERVFFEQIKFIRQIERSTKMEKILSRRNELLSLFCMFIIAFALYSPLVCHGEEYGLSVDFSPYTINISSERLGAIRVLTDVRYSNFVADGDSMFIYFNGCSDSVPNIKATRDSLGNLILRFSLDDLLSVENCLVRDEYNQFVAVITMENGDEYIGEEEVYITDKQGMD